MWHWSQCVRGGGGRLCHCWEKKKQARRRREKTRERTGDNTQQVIYLWSGQGYEKHRVWLPAATRVISCDITSRRSESCMYVGFFFMCALHFLLCGDLFFLQQNHWKSVHTHICPGFNLIKGEVHDFYKTSWVVEFEALSRMVKVWGSCDKPFKRYSWLKNLLCERPQGTNSWRHWAVEKLSKCADSSHFTFFHFVFIAMHFGVALATLAGEK